MKYQSWIGTLAAFLPIRTPRCSSTSRPITVELLVDPAGSRARVTLTPDNLGYVIDGRTYVNYHTAANGSGEIRGQVVR